MSRIMQLTKGFFSYEPDGQISGVGMGAFISRPQFKEEVYVKGHVHAITVGGDSMEELKKGKKALRTFVTKHKGQLPTVMDIIKTDSCQILDCPCDLTTEYFDTRADVIERIKNFKFILKTNWSTYFFCDNISIMLCRLREHLYAAWSWKYVELFALKKGEVKQYGYCK